MFFTNKKISSSLSVSGDNPNEHFYQKLNLFFLAITFFFIPISAGPAYFFSILAIIVFFFTKTPLEKIEKSFNEPLTLWLYAFVATHAMSLMWTEDIKNGIWFLEKFTLYLFFPIILAMLNKEWAMILLKSFFAGVFLSELMSYFIWLDFITSPSGNTDHTAFIGHILYSPIIAFTAYLILFKLFQEWKKIKYWQKVGFTFFFFTITLNLFFTEGRTGMIAFAGLMIVLAWQMSETKRLTNTILTIITLFFLVSLLYLALPDFTRRADQAINNIFHFLNTSEGAGSVGHRAVMFILGLQIALDNWLLGVGLGDFTIKFTEYLNQRKFISIGTNQPHNQYLFSWATSGILALISIGGIFYTLIKINKKVNDSYTYLRTGLITLFLIILFFENHLLRSNSSLLFVYFLALFFGRKPQKP